MIFSTSIPAAGPAVACFGGRARMRRLWRVSALPLLVLLVAAFARPAFAAGDAVEFFNNVDVAQGDEAHDVVVFFGNANIDGTVNGDVVVIFGNVHLRGAVRHDVVNIFGGVHMEENASIDKDLVNLFGGTQMGENTSIGKDAVVLFGRLRAAPTANFGGNRVVQPFWIFIVPLVIVVLVLRGIVWGVRYPRRRYYMRGY